MGEFFVERDHGIDGEHDEDDGIDPDVDPDNMTALFTLLEFGEKKNIEGKNKLERLIGKKMFARCPAFTDGTGFSRLFSSRDALTINGKIAPVLNGTRLLELKDERLVIKNDREEIILDIPTMHPRPEIVSWLWVAQPKYRPGEAIKGFFVMRERLNPFVMALRKTSGNGMVRVVKAKSTPIKVLPVSFDNIVTSFDIPMRDLKYIENGEYRVEVIDEHGKVLASVPVTIAPFEKKELNIIVEQPSWVLDGEDMIIGVTARYYHGNVATDGIITVKENGQDEITSNISTDGTTRITIGGLANVTKREFSVRVEDGNAVQDETTFSVISAKEPLVFKVIIPSTPFHATIPVPVIIKIETPDGLAVEMQPVDIGWKRVGKLETESLDHKSRATNTDASGEIALNEMFEAEGTYELSATTSSRGQSVSATRSIAVNRMTQGTIFIENELDRAKYKEGDRISGKMKITALPETLSRITYGYVELITDKIVESKKIKIKKGTATYDFSGAVDFWGTACIDFYINPPQLGLDYDSIESLDKAFCLHAKATAVIEPSHPFSIKLDVDAPGTSTTGKEITISVKIDPVLLKDEITVFGALVDQRIITSHDPSSIDKTFVNPTPPLDVIVYDSRPIQVPPGRVHPRSAQSLFGLMKSSSHDSPRSSYNHVSLSSRGDGPQYQASTSRSFMSGPPSGPPRPPGGISYGMPPSRCAPPSDTSRAFKSMRDEMIDELDRLKKLRQETGRVVIREDFAPSIMLSPVKVENDIATFVVKVPDAITTYSIMIYACGASHFGHATREIVVKNPIFTRVQIPAYATLDDRIVARAIVTNLTGEEIPVLVTPADLKNVKFTGENLDVLSMVPARESRAVSMDIACTGVGEARMLVDVTAREFSERVGLDQQMWIYPPGKPEIEDARALVSQEKPMVETIAVHGDEAFSLVTINVLPSMDVAQIEGLESLAQYPHGCMEQTCASTLPNVIVFEYLKGAGKLSPELEKKLVDNMKAGVERILGYRKPDGGFSYWGGESTIFYTALGMYVLSRLKKHAKVPGNVIDDSAKYLEARQSSNGSWIVDGHASIAPRSLPASAITAYIAWCMAKAGKPSKTAENWLSLNLTKFMDDPVVLALALEACPSKSVDASSKDETIKNLLVSIARRDGDKVFWDDGSALARGVESTARVAIALASVYPDNIEIVELLQGAVAFMLSKRGARGWASTSDTLLASDAIARIGVMGAVDFTMSVKVNGTERRQEKITRKTAAWKLPDIRNIFIDDLHGGDNEIAILMEGKGTCHVVIETSRYYHAKPVINSLARLSAKVGSNLAAGSEATIEIAVEPSSRALESVMVEINLPPIFAFTEAGIGNQHDHAEIQKNTACVFLRNLEKPETITVPVIAVQPGTCRIDARLYEMYDPAIQQMEPSIVTVS